MVAQVKMILYLEKNVSEGESDGSYKGLNLNSFICLYVLKYLKILDESREEEDRLDICFLDSKKQRKLFIGSDSSDEEHGFSVCLSDCRGAIRCDDTKSLDVVLPALHIHEENYYIGGLCAVLRYVISKVNVSQEFKGILGHNGGNLSSPAEVSTWTRFVEIDLPSVVLGPLSEGVLPKPLATFEIHMKQPIKIHNIRSRLNKGAASEGDGSKEEDPILEYARNNHIFCEGPDLLLSDLIVYPMIYFIVQKYSKSLLDCTPTVSKWFQDTMGKDGESVFQSLGSNSMELLHHDAMKHLSLNDSSADFSFVFPQDMDANTSLYKCDPRRNNPKARVYTKQNDIDDVLTQLNSAKICDKVFKMTNLNHEPIDWSSVPPEMHPKSGGLPPSRLDKKCQQLECIYHAVKSLQPKEGDVIVDFCSGGGHLSLLLAHFFPQSQIYLVENKFESLLRAKRRSQNLKNVTFFQCNMDYFRGHFDIGLSLHACGVATDLVLSRCLSEKAKFVSCPCCYGSISDNHALKYPRSEYFKKVVKPQEYYILCHAADQVHPEGSDNSIEKSAQGRIAMNLVDSDRLLQALDAGYKVKLSQLMPPSCTPKNNLLIGDLF